MKDFYTEYMNMNEQRNKFERKLDEYNHTMELIRTVVPCIVLILQVIILIKIIN
jgi:heme/copper-type cytochrome/quinol oxidase subunit 2